MRQGKWREVAHEGKPQGGTRITTNCLEEQQSAALRDALLVLTHHTRQQAPKHNHTLVLLVRRWRSRKPFVLFSCQARNPTSPSQQQLPLAVAATHAHPCLTLPPTPTTSNTDGHPRTCSIRSVVYQFEFERGLQSSGLVWLGRGRSAWVRACRGWPRCTHTSSSSSSSSSKQRHQQECD